MIKVTVESDSVYNVPNKIHIDYSDEIRKHYVQLLEGMSCTIKNHEDFPNKVSFDKEGNIIDIKVCCQKFEKVIRETISNNRFKK